MTRYYGLDSKNNVKQLSSDEIADNPKVVALAQGDEHPKIDFADDVNSRIRKEVRELEENRASRVRMEKNVASIDRTNGKDKIDKLIDVVGGLHLSLKQENEHKWAKREKKARRKKRSRRFFLNLITWSMIIGCAVAASVFYYNFEKAKAAVYEIDASGYIDHDDEIIRYEDENGMFVVRNDGVIFKNGTRAITYLNGNDVAEFGQHIDYGAIELWAILAGGGTFGFCLLVIGVGLRRW